MSKNAAIPQIFDENLAKCYRARGWQMGEDGNFLRLENGARLLERLDDIARPFPRRLDIGGGLIGLKGAETFDILGPVKPPSLDAEQKIGQGQTTPSRPSKNSATSPSGSQKHIISDFNTLPLWHADKRPHLAGQFDLVVANLTLQSVNDLVGLLVQLRALLKPDGLFLGSFFGGETLESLRTSLLKAELEVTGRVSPRVAPFADIRDMGALLSRAGFALPVADTDRISVDYSHPLALMKDLRAMGEANNLQTRSRQFLPRKTLARSFEIYQSDFKSPNQKGHVSAHFDIIHLTGWQPHESQQKPLKPGSGRINLGQALNPDQKL